MEKTLQFGLSTRTDTVMYPKNPAENTMRLSCMVGVIDNIFREVNFGTIYKNGKVVGVMNWNGNGFSHDVAGEDKAEADTLISDFTPLFASEYGVTITEPIVIEMPQQPVEE